MKKSIMPGLLVLALAACSPAFAQKKSEQEEKIAKRFNNALLRLARVNLSQGREVQKVAVIPETPQEIFDAKLGNLNNQAGETRKELENKKNTYIPKPASGQQIDKDLLPLLAAMPEPITNLPQAKQEVKISTDNNVYTRYIEKVKSYREGLAKQVQQDMAANQKDVGQMKKEAYQNAKNTEDMLAANPLIQQMGGMDKLKNMTPEQRAALAKQMTEKVKQNPAAFAGRQNNASQAGYDAAVANRNKAAASLEIDKRLTAIMAHAKEMAAIVGKLQLETDGYFDAIYKKTNEEHGQRVAALPLEEMGEYGRDKNTHPVDLAYNIVLYPEEKQHAVSDKEVWMRYLEALKITIAEYNDLLSRFSGYEQLMAEKGVTPAGLSTGICDDIIRIAEMAKFQAGRNASWQRTFDEKVLQVYE